MVITTTAVGFLILSLGVAFCGWRFLIAFRNTQLGLKISTAGLLVSLIFVGLSIQNGLIGLGTLFFAGNSSTLYLTLVITNFLLIPIAMLGIYATKYIFYPEEKYTTSIILIGVTGLICLLITIFTFPQPFLTSNNGVDWNLSRAAALSTFFLLFMALGAPLYIFLRLFSITENKELKIVSLIILLLHAGGIINSFLRLVLFSNAFYDARTRILDVGVGVIGAIFILYFAIGPFLKNTNS